MRETKITRVGPSRTAIEKEVVKEFSGLAKAEDIFFEDGTISQKEIKEMAGMIAGDIKSAVSAEKNPQKQGTIAQRLFSQFLHMVGLHLQKEVMQPDEKDSKAPTVLLDTFRFHEMGAGDWLEKRGYFKRPDGADFKFVHKDGTEVTRQEVGDVLHTIRAALTEELKNILPDINLYVQTERESQLSRKVSELHDEKILKKPRRDGVEWQRAKLANNRALQELYALPKRSPYLAYPIREMEEGLGVQIQKKMDMTTLWEIMGSGPLPPIHDVIRYFTDALRGMDFLWDYGFELSDLGLENYGVDNSKNKGFLFDYDYLYKRDEHPQNFGPSKEIAILYSMGRALESIVNTYKSSNINFDELAQIEQIVEQMKWKGDGEKPTIKGVIEMLDSFLATPS